MSSMDLSILKVVTAQDIESAARTGATGVSLRAGAVVTPSARDLAGSRGIAITFDGSAAGPAQAKKTKWDDLLNSPEAERIKAEIITTGRKLWQRQYVDGNGGNISHRLNDEAVICTPTLCSKADLTHQDMCLVDLDGNQLAGGRARTSEILLHLEIYKAVPEARAVVHCHPPHATAYAITGRVPPTCVIPEFEVFVGRVAVSPYETPGTKKFAETVLPFVKSHNTVLLSNHGIVCWADTVTHAEWYAEVLETYCWTLMIASQLGAPISSIPPDKTSDLLGIKQRLGIPDARLAGLPPGPAGMKECQLCDFPESGAIAIPPAAGSGPGAGEPTGEEIDWLVKSVTDAVMAAFEPKTGG